MHNTKICRPQTVEDKIEYIHYTMNDFAEELMSYGPRSLTRNHCVNERVFDAVNNNIRNTFWSTKEAVEVYVKTG